MKLKTTNRKSAILMPVLVGSAIGAGIALVLAPKKGKEIRKDLKRFATTTRHQIARVIYGGRELLDEGREVVAGAVTTVKEKYDKGTERLEKFVAPIAEEKVTADLKAIAANTRDTFVSSLDKGKAFYKKGRKTISKAMGAVQKEYIRKNAKHRHAA